MVAKDALISTQDVTACLKDLPGFRPNYLKIESKYFFLPLAISLSKDEQNAMLIEFREFDRTMIHKKYRELVDT